MSDAPIRSSGARRVTGCTLSLALGLAAAGLLLFLVGRQTAQAAGTVRSYPGSAPCDTSLQACIDGSSPGDSIVITAGTYTESLTLNKVVSLTGVASNTVILQALTGQGGGLMAGGNVVISGTLFLSNTTHSQGGGLSAGGAVTITGGLFQNNVCTQDNCRGGGLYVVATVTLTNAQFISNSARLDGGGVYAGDDARLTGGQLQANVCSQDNCRGGGLYASTNLTLTGTAFLSNTARFSAGGAFANAGSAASVNNALFQHNQCTQNGCQGGGMYAIGSLVLTDTRFIDNYAPQGGGGGLRADGTVSLNRAQFSSNIAFQGGGLFHGGSGGTVVNSLFANNIATSNGAAVYVNATSGQFTMLFTTIAVSSSQNGMAAISVFTGSVGIIDTLIASHNIGIQRLGGSVFEDYNLFSNVSQSTTGGVAGGARSWIGQAEFRSQFGNNYHLWIISAALDAGTDVGVDIDFDGQPRPQYAGFDIGYDETSVARLYLPLVRR